MVVLVGCGWWWVPGIDLALPPPPPSLPPLLGGASLCRAFPTITPPLIIRSSFMGRACHPHLGLIRVEKSFHMFPPVPTVNTHCYFHLMFQSVGASQGLLKGLRHCIKLRGVKKWVVTLSLSHICILNCSSFIYMTKKVLLTFEYLHHTR